MQAVSDRVAIVKRGRMVQQGTVAELLGRGQYLRLRADDNELLIALRHPLRRQILRAMASQAPISPREISDELREPLSNVSYHVRVLADCGATWSDVAKVTIFLAGSMEHFAAVNERYAAAVGEHWPARSTVAVAALPLGAAVEIEAIVYAPEKEAR